MLHSIYYFPILPLPIPKYYQKECSLKLYGDQAAFKAPVQLFNISFDSLSLFSLITSLFLFNRADTVIMLVNDVGQFEAQPVIFLIFKLQLHNAIYWLRFYSNSLIHILSLSNSHNNVASIQKHRGDKLHHVIVALESLRCKT